MSNIDFGFKMLSDSLSNLQQSRYRSALGQGLGPFGQDQSNDPGAVPAVNPGGQPDKLSPGSTAGMMDRAKQYAPIFQQAASQYQGIPNLAQVAMGVAATESGFNPRAIGPGGAARGMMQFIGPTGRQYGLDGNSVFDPTASAQAGTKYLADLYRRYGNWPDALRAYNGGGDPNYVAKVGRFTSMFSGFGGTGGTPAPAAVAGGGGVTPPPPLPPAQQQQPPASPDATQSTTADLPNVQPSSGGDDATAAAQLGGPSLADVTQQLNTAQQAAGVPPTSPQIVARLMSTPEGQQRVQAFIHQNSPAGGAAAASGGSDVPGLGDTAAAGFRRFVPPLPAPASLRPPPLGSGMPGSRGPVSDPNPPMGAPPAPPGARPDAPMPVRPPPAGGGGPERVAGRGPGRAPSGPPDPKAPPTKEDMTKAHAADPTNPPAGPPLNENGFFPYHSVYGDKFTLPQLIYNIKHANPGINPAVLAGAVLLAQPMLKDAATEHVRDYQETAREYMETQREQAQAERLAFTQSEIDKRSEATNQIKLQALSSLDAYRKAQTSLGKDKFAERIREFTVKDDEAKQALFDREQKIKADIEDRRTRYKDIKDEKQRSQAARDLSNLLTQRRDLERQIHNAVADRIRLVTATLPPGDQTQDAIMKDEEARAKKAQAEMKVLEDRLRLAGANVGSSEPVSPISALQ